MGTEERCPGKGLPLAGGDDLSSPVTGAEASAGEGRMPSPVGGAEAGDGTGSPPPDSPRQDCAEETSPGAGPSADPAGRSGADVAEADSRAPGEADALSAEELREARAVRLEADPGKGEADAGAGWLAEAVRSQGRPAGLSSPLESDARRVRKAAGREKGKALQKAGAASARHTYTPEQRILLIDTWRRSGLPVKQFGPLVGLSPHTLYKWNADFEKYGPEGLMDKKRGSPKGSRLPEVTKRMILMLKEENPEYGCQRISDLLARGPGVPASASAVALFLKESGYECEEVPTERHPDKPRRFERAKPGQLWQTDLFTFTMRRQNRRVHMVGFMDDHSRFLTGYAIRGMASTDMVIETLRAAVSAFGAPEELLTDNGPQYSTWRGVSRFTKECAALGIRQIVSRPRHPQTLGKIERFWGTLWRDFLKSAIFLDLEDARRRVGLFIDHYNFQRPHQSLDGLVPADRFFGAAPAVMASMKSRLQANALEIARKGFPKKPFYLAGRIDGRAVSLHEENGRVFMVGGDGTRQEVDLVTPFGMDEEEKAALLREAEAAGGDEAWEPGLSALADSLEAEGDDDDD